MRTLTKTSTFPVAADEVDFATAAPVVARDDPELFFFQKARRQVLGLPAGAAASFVAWYRCCSLIR